MSDLPFRAELIADRGEVAVSDDFFRSRQFLDAENVTHTLRILGAEVELLAPLIVRQIGHGPERDAISPYGYPGLGQRVRTNPSIARVSTDSPEEAAGGIDPAAIDFSAIGLVSVFLRHRLDLVALEGATRRNVVQVADPELPAKSRPSDRRQVRRNLEAGYRLELVPGAATSAAQRAGFLDLYEQTMRRTGAAAHYFFGAEYFDRILAADRTWLALAYAPDGGLAAASLAVGSDGFLHYYLSGSADTHLNDSPMKNIVTHLIDHARDLSLPLNLGGGITPGDALEDFKRGFANREIPWQTSEIICDPEKYTSLSGNRPSGSFFPAYRA